MRVTKGNKMKFHNETNETVKTLLERLSNEYPRRRVRIWYGDAKTGRSWNEEHDIMGYIGRSTGNDKIPLLVNNVRSLGGGAVLDHCIIRIDDIKTKRTLYKHKNFHTELLEPTLNKDYSVYEVFRTTLTGIELVATFKTEEKAKKYVKFMDGERYSK